MQKTESLDELIAKKAVEFADQIKAAAAMGKKRVRSQQSTKFYQNLIGFGVTH